MTVGKICDQCCHGPAPPLRPAPPSVVQNGPTPATHVKLARFARQLDMGGGRRAILDHRWRRGAEWRRRAVATLVTDFSHSHFWSYKLLFTHFRQWPNGVRNDP